jgi:hypothetical protein
MSRLQVALISPGVRKKLHQATGIGLGDCVSAFTNLTGIAAVWGWVSKVTGRPCGCQSRRVYLNQLRFYFPVRWVSNRIERPSPVSDGGGPPVRPMDLAAVAKDMDPNFQKSLPIARAKL